MFRIRSLIAILSIFTLTFQSVGAVSYPSSGPSGSYSGGSFGTYFQNLFTNPCPAGQSVVGFSTGASNYGEPICSNTSIAAGSLGDTLRYDGSAWVANSVIFNDGADVGIGNSSPASKLDVRGILTVNPSGFGDAINFYNGYKIRTVGGGGIQIQGAPYVAIGNTSGLNGATFSVGNTGAASLTLYPDVGQSGLEISGYDFGVDSNGSLGIGTLTPNAKLEISSNTDNAFRINKIGGTNWSYMEWLYGGTRKYWQGLNSAGYYAIESDTNTGRIYLSGAQISIGVANPSYRLDVGPGYVNSASGFCIGGDCIPAWSNIGDYLVGNPGYLAGYNAIGTLGSSSFYQSGSKLFIGDVPYILSGSMTDIGQLSIYSVSGSSSANPMISLGQPGYPDCKIWVNGSSVLESNCALGVIDTTLSFSPNQIIRADQYGTGLAGSIIYESGSNIGIGTSTPSAKLEVNGQIKITGGSPGVGKVLTSDASGLASWQNPGSISFTGVASFNSRTGVVIGASGDYTASQITNVAAGLISSNNVQNAINELDSEKQVTITGAATTVTLDNLLANAALVSTAGGKIGASATISTTELGYLDNVSSNIQDQLDAKEPTITSGTIGQYYRGDKSWQNFNTSVTAGLTGAISPFLTTDMTPSRALASDTSGKLSVASTTLTELNYVNGVTSSIQTQLNTLSTNKANLASPIFTGIPTAPTAASGTNDTQIANTAFVNTAISNGISASALAGNFWYLSGNTIGANDFIGTTNVKDLVFKTNSLERFRIGTAPTSSGTFFNFSGGDILIDGLRIGKGNGGDDYNTVVGKNALANSDATTYSNTAIGYDAMAENIIGFKNTAIGEGALGLGTGSFENTAIGVWALRNNQGYENTALGVLALGNNTSGNGNTAIGRDAFSSMLTGSSNTALGRGAGDTLISGDNNIAIGANIQLSSTTDSNQLNIGNAIRGSEIGNSNQKIYIGYADMGGDYPVNIYGPTVDTGNWPANISLIDSRPMGTEVGGGITFAGNDGFAFNRSFATIQGAKENSQTGNVNGMLKFLVRSSVGGGQFEAMRLTASGNLGIGTSTPTANLQVVGSTRFDLGSDATGDMFYRSAGGNLSRLALGSAGKILTSSGGAPAWADAATLVAPVDSVFGRTGAVIGASGDYTAGQITNIAAGNISSTNVQAALNELDTEKAPLASPSLTGTPTAPTASSGTNNTQIATTAFVKSQAYLTGYTETDPKVGANTTNYLSKWNGSALVTSSIFDNGNIGIGTATPGSYKLNVVGDSYFAGDLTLTGNLFVDSIVNRSVTNLTISGNLLPDANAPLSFRNLGSNAQRWNNLYLSGQITIGGGSPGVGKYLTSDANGLASWTTLTIPADAVTSVFGRTGAVIGASGDYTAGQITNIAAGNISSTNVQAALNELDTEKAPLASPALTGIPTAPTPALSDSGTTIATTAFVKNQGFLTSGGNIVTSFNGRTGAVVPGSSDYTTTQVAEGTNLYFNNARVASALTGAISPILTTNLTAGRALSSDTSGKIAVATTTLTELNYLTGATSNVQAQLNTLSTNKADLASPALTGTPTAPTASSGTNNTQIATTAFVKSQAYLTGYTETDPKVGANTTNYLSKWNGSALVTSSIFDNGNIGIGTATPGSYKLNVDGDTYISGALSILGKLYVDTIVNRTVTNVSISGGIVPDSSSPQSVRDLGTNTNRWNNLYLSGQITIGGGSPGVGKYLTSDANGLASWTTLTIPADAVTSVFGRTGAVVSASGDYTAGQITNVAAGTISSTNVQAALNELDTEKEPSITAPGSPTMFWDGMKNWQTLDTSVVIENGNLYFTNARVASALTGAISPILTTNLTASRALSSDASGKIAVATTTLTELNYLTGATSNIQVQINAKAPLASPALTGTPTAPTPALSDSGTTIATTAFVKNQGFLSSGGNFVVSFNGRTGAVVPGSSDYTTTQVAEGTNLYFTNARVASALTGAISPILTTNLTAGRALSSDTSGKIAVATTTLTELNYLTGATSNVQAQLNTLSTNKADLASPALTGTPTAPTPALSDSGTTLATTAFVKSQAYLTGYTESDPEVGANTTNYLSKWNGSALVTSSLFDNGNVGIGTATPGTYKLNVVGNSFFGGDLTLTGKLFVDTIVNRTVTNITVSGSILPDSGAPLVNRDIGSNTARWNNLYLTGQITIGGGSPGAGKILTSDANGLATWTSTSSLISANNDWSLSGNAVGANDFIGSTNGQDVVFKANNTEGFRLTKSGNIIGLGNGTIGALTNSLVLGNSAGSSMSGSYNSAVGGSQAGINMRGSNNSAFGGLRAGSSMSGSYNSALGGSYAGQNLDGSYNSAIGGQYAGYNMNGSNNSAFGGIRAGSSMSGTYNVAIGTAAGTGMSTGDSNIYIGSYAVGNAGQSNQFSIGNVIYGSGMGSDGLTNGRVGIGTMTPGAKLEVAGQVKITGGSPGSGKVLTSDATGLASWQGAPSPCTPTGTYSWGDCYGDNVLQNNTTGDANISLGDESLRNNTTGYQNTVLGVFAAYNNTVGYRNTVLGNQALYTQTGGNGNVSIGAYSMYWSKGGDENVAVGNDTLNILDQGYGNVALGAYNMRQFSTGSLNTALGYGAGFSLSGGDNNIFIGANTAPNISGTGSNQLNIGYWIYGYNGNIGIGVPDPQAKLHVDGKLVVNEANSVWGMLQLGNPTVPGPGNLSQTSISFMPGVTQYGNPSASSERWEIGANLFTGESGIFGIYDATNTAYRLVVRMPDGNVGIGVTNPQMKLVVAGDGNPSLTGWHDDSAQFQIRDTGAGTKQLTLGVNTVAPTNYGYIVSSENGADQRILALNPDGGTVTIGTTVGMTGASLTLSGGGIAFTGTTAIVIGDTTGNARNAESIDIQYARSAADEIADGTGVVVMGGYNKVSTGSYDTVIGTYNYIHKDGTYGIGLGDTVIGYGNQNNLSFGNSTIVGYNNTSTGAWSTMFGQDNVISSSFDNAITIGKENLVGGHGGIAMGRSNWAGAYSVVVGLNNNGKESGDPSQDKYIIFGTDNTTGIYSSLVQSQITIIGRNNTGSAFGAMIFGSGIDNYVEGSVQIGTTNAGKITLLSSGSLGIGTISPTSKLDVAGTGTFQGLKILSGASNGYVLTSDASGNARWAAASAGGSSTGWSLSGNAIGANDFIGTTNAKDVIFKTNNTQQMVITSASGYVGIGFIDNNSDGTRDAPIEALQVVSGALIDNLYIGTHGRANTTAIGRNALQADRSYGSNTAIGLNAMYSNTGGGQNTAIGYNSLYGNINGEYNVAVGQSAIYNGGNKDTAIGYSAMGGHVSGTENTSLGYYSYGVGATGSYVTAIGSNALRSNQSDYNTAIGAYSLYSNTIGTQNVAVGNDSLGSSIDGDYNTAVGYQAMVNNSSGDQNTALGNYALRTSTGGFGNTALGRSSLYSATSNYNTAVGLESLVSITTGGNNAGLGYRALYTTTTGGNNTALGTDAGYSALYVLTGSNNTFLGYAARFTNTGVSNATAIGANTTVSQSNTVILGNGANVGIGTSTPSDKLVVVGTGSFQNIKILSGATNGYVLTSDAVGNARWAAAGSTNWSLSGNAIGANDFIGSTNAQNLRIYASGAQRMTLDTTGNLGIGTVAPTERLELSGSSSNGIRLRIQNFDATGYSSATFFDSASVNKAAFGYGNASVADTNLRTRAYAWTATNTNFVVSNEASGALMIVTATGSVGIGTMSPGQKLEVSGNVLATSYMTSSDKNLKENILPLPDALAKVLSLRGYSFNWKKDGRQDVGIIAQEVEAVYPEIVHTDPNTGLKSVEYGNLIAPMIEAMREQQKMIEKQQSEINELKSALKEIKSSLAQ